MDTILQSAASKGINWREVILGHEHNTISGIILLIITIASLILIFWCVVGCCRAFREINDYPLSSDNESDSDDDMEMHLINPILLPHDEEAQQPIGYQERDDQEIRVRHPTHQESDESDQSHDPTQAGASGGGTTSEMRRSSLASSKGSNLGAPAVTHGSRSSLASKGSVAGSGAEGRRGSKSSKGSSNVSAAGNEGRRGSKGSKGSLK